MDQVMEGMVRYKEYLLVKVSSIFHNFRIGKSKPLQNKLFASGGYDGWSWELPEGRWQILANAYELEENELEGIIEFPDHEGYPNYGDTQNGHGFKTMRESFLSLLASHNLEAKECLVLKIKT